MELPPDVTAFFVPLDDPNDGATGGSATRSADAPSTTSERFRATEATSGPWDPGAMHGGPPSALLARALEQCEPRPDHVLGRVTIEILGPVPVGEVQVRSQVVRPGRSVELVEAVLAAGGRDVAQGRGWRIRRTTRTAVPDPSPTPDLPEEQLAMEDGWQGGYLRAVEWRRVHGHFLEPGPACAWTRLRVAVVEGEQPTGVQRALAVADSGNGLSSVLDLREWHFINPELTVHLHRQPVGEWVCVDAVTAIGDVGLATTRLHDRDGPVGVGAQSLLVAPRPQA